MKDVTRLLDNLKSGNYNNYLDEVPFEFSNERESNQATEVRKESTMEDASMISMANVADTSIKAARINQIKKIDREMAKL